MDYQKHYNLLITRAQNRTLNNYFEIHHIIPLCMGGSNDDINLVQLTAREHYIAHQLLIKIYPGVNLLIFAANMMTLGNYKHSGARSKNRIYGWLRELHSKAQSDFAKQGYVNNPNYGMTGKRHSDKTKKLMAVSNRKPDEIVTCPKCHKSGGISNMKRYHFDNCDKPNPTLTCPHCNKVGGIGIMKRWHFDNCKKRVTSL